MITKNLNNYNILAIFFDLEKTFVTIISRKLLEKLCLDGIRGIQLKIFPIYLCGRNQIYDGNETLTNYGLPQGTIILQILYIIYVSDLFIMKCKNSLIIQFADNCYYIHRRVLGERF